MADNKKKQIKQCRIKTDTCFKWHCLGKVFGLNLDDIGLMYMISQIQDDENNLRYTLIEEEILDMFKETEAEWLALHGAKMKSDALYRIAFSDLNGQRKATTNHYKAEVARRKAYNDRIKNQNSENIETKEDNENNENGELKEDVITSDEIKETTKPLFKDVFYFKDIDKHIEVSCLESNKENIPKTNDIERMFQEGYTNDDIIEILKIGNAQGWIKHYDDVFAETCLMNAEPPAEENKESEEYPI